MKIEKLTPEQEAYLPVFRQQFLDNACGGRIDPEKLKEAISDAYAVIGAKMPELVICPSPKAAMAKLKDLGASEGNDYNSSYLWGSQDNCWSAWGKFAEYIGVVLDEKTSKHLDIMYRIGQQCEWWWPYDEIVVVSERPVYIKWDDQSRLHGETGPAVEYSDGYAMYSWHGQSIPGEWVMGNPPKAKDALHWKNMDQRAAACEIIGWANILDELKSKIIDDSNDPMWGKLVEVNIPDSGKERFLDAVCGTGRRFALPVPLNTKTVDEAQSALHGGIPASILRFSEIRT